MKKFFTYLAIAIGVLLFLCVGLVVFLMLAPGTEVFGIKYISAVVGKYENTIQKSFTVQDIYLYADDVPINISFAKTGTVGIEYVQHYQGFTRAADVPEVTFKNKDGQPFDAGVSTNAVYIYVNQYKKFVWSNDVKDFYLNLNLPFEYKNNGTIHVETKNSVITFSGSNKTVKELYVETGKRVEFKNNLTIQNLTIKTSEAVELGNNINIAPLTAGATSSLNVSIPNASLKVTNPVKSGDITFTTAGGNLKFNTCRNLTVKSGSGSIEQPTGKYIDGNLKFETDSGNVNIDNVKGTKNKITSTAGKINIGFCAGDLEIVTNRADIVLGTVNNATISTTTGDIAVTYVNGKIVASSTRSGDIACGRVIGDATLTTKIGDIIVSGAVGGNLALTSEDGKLQMVSCNNLTVSAEKGSLSGYNNAKIVVNGVANIKSGSGDVTISKILGTSNNSAITDNKINVNSGAINIETIVGSSKIDSYNSTISLNTVGKITINTSYSPITIVSAVDGATITNISGNINVGTLDNPAVTTGTVDIKSNEGTINVYHTTGDVYLSSNQAITLYNKSSNKIYFNTKGGGNNTGRGQVTAYRLQGEVKAYSQHDVILTFTQITNNVRVDTSGVSSKVIIDATCIAANKVNYWVRSQKGVAADLYYNDTKQTTASEIKMDNDISYHTITAITTNAKVTLKLGAEVSD